MKRLLSCWAFLTLATLLVACGSSTPPLPRLAGDAVILAFGDSLTHGSGVRPEQSYPAVLEQLTGRTVINAGIPGEVTMQGVQRLPELLDEHQPQLLILCHGGNDLLRKLERARTIDNLRTMIGMARERGIAVVLIGVPQPALLFMDSAEFYRDLAEEFDLPLEDEILPAIESDNGLKSDQIHPNAEGYRQLAGAIAELLRRAGAI